MANQLQSKGAAGKKPASPLLTTRKLGKSFGAVNALSDVDLDVYPGEAIGVVGPNGAGKSTLMSVMSGAQRPSTGSVVFEEKDVTGTFAAEMCRNGLVRTHQVPKPFEGLSAFENIFVAASFGSNISSKEAYQVSVDAMETCGMLHLANRRAASLGLLDRKRLEVARAVATQPSVLLLDEVGGGLTDAEADELVAIILHIRAQGTAIIWIEHIVHVLLQVAERLICMDGGKIIADDLPDKVMSDPKVMQAYLGHSIT